MRARCNGILLLATLGLFACPEPEPAADGGTDAGITGERLELVMQRVHLAADGTVVEAVAAGATVALDQPGLDRREAVSDGQGLVRFDGVDWSVGPLDVTVHHPCCHLGSMLAVHQDEWQRMSAEDEGGVLRWGLYEPEADETPTLVTVSGSAQNMLDPGHSLTVSSDAWTSQHQQPGAAWSLQVPSGQPFTLVALEWGPVATRTVSVRGVEQAFYQWTVLEHPGVSADTTLDLDFAASTTPVHFSGSLAMPAGQVGSFFDSAAMYATVLGGEQRRAFVGAVTRSDVTSDGMGFEYEGEYLALPGVTLTTQYYAFRAVAGPLGWSQRWEPGAPTASGPSLAEPHAVDPPAVPGVPYSVDGALSWQRNAADQANTELKQQLLLYRASVGGELRMVWNLFLPPAATSMEFPALPSSADRAQVLGTSTLQGYLRQTAWAEDGEFLLIDAFAGPLDVNP